MFKLTTIAIVLFIATMINLAGCFISWQRQRAKSGLYFATGMTGMVFWTLASGFDYAATSIPLKVFFAKLEYTGYNVAFACFALFILNCTGDQNWRDNKWVRIMFLSLPLSTILLAWTNDWHGWLWSGFTRSDVGDNMVIFEHGPGYIWALITGYLMIFMIIIPLLYALRRGSDLLRQQARLLLFASLITVAGNLLYLLENPALKGVDWSPISATISGMLFLWALYGARLLDIIPIARDQLVNSLSDGMIVLDTQNRIIDINQVTASIFGVQINHLIGKKLEDVAPASSSFLEHPPEQEIKTELKIDAANRYFDLLISPLRERQKKVIGRLMIFRDITERKENELRLLQLTQAVEQSPASIVITDMDGQITHVNSQFTELTGYTYAESVGKATSLIQSGQTPENVYQDMWQTIKSGRIWRGELLNKRKNGELYWEFEVVAPVLDGEGHIVNFVAVKEDITRRKEAEKQLKNAYDQLEEQMKEIQALQSILQEQATRDALTGLFNRHYLTETLDRELARANREGYSISFVLLDIDHFKNINDTFGHAMGDDVLKRIAGLLLRLTRNADIICRYGGEEFLVVLPDTKVDRAVQIAERWRAAIQGLNIPLEDGRTVKVTISCGVSEFPFHGSTEAKVISVADKALYSAKRNGRNQVST